MSRIAQTTDAGQASIQAEVKLHSSISDRTFRGSGGGKRHNAERFVGLR